MKKKISVLINKRITKYNKRITVVSDKSLSLRALILASQCIGISKIKNLLESEDILNCIKALKKLGVKIVKKNNIHFVYGNGLNSFKTNNKTLGLFIKHRAISVLRRSPPDNAVALTFLKCVIENSAISFSTASFCLETPFFTICAIANKFS